MSKLGKLISRKSYFVTSQTKNVEDCPEMTFEQFENREFESMDLPASIEWVGIQVVKTYYHGKTTGLIAKLYK